MSNECDERVGVANLWKSLDQSDQKSSARTSDTLTLISVTCNKAVATCSCNVTRTRILDAL